MSELKMSIVLSLLRVSYTSPLFTLLIPLKPSTGSWLEHCFTYYMEDELPPVLTLNRDKG